MVLDFILELWVPDGTQWCVSGSPPPTRCPSRCRLGMGNRTKGMCCNLDSDLSMVGYFWMLYFDQPFWSTFSSFSMFQNGWNQTWNLFWTTQSRILLLMDLSIRLWRFELCSKKGSLLGQGRLPRFKGSGTMCNPWFNRVIHGKTTWKQLHMREPGRYKKLWFVPSYFMDRLDTWYALRYLQGARKAREKTGIRYKAVYLKQVSPVN